MRPLPRISFLITWAALATTAIAAPQYQIFDLGVLPMTADSRANSVSPGGIAVGGSGTGNGSQAFTWTQGGGLIALPLLGGRNSSNAFGVNDNGIVVGSAFNVNGAFTNLPVIWQNSVVSQLPLPSGWVSGQAFDINASGLSVGYAQNPAPEPLQRGVIYSLGSATVITRTTANGGYFAIAYGINDSGRIVGSGVDPTNQFIGVGIVYDMSTDTAFDVGTFQGGNATSALAVNNKGQIVGYSSYSFERLFPFIWTEGIGMVAIPLLPGKDRGEAQGVNSAGWVVGTDWLLTSSYAPFLYDGTTTYRLSDLLPPGSGWSLSGHSNLSINDNGVIVGTGLHNGATRAFTMVPLPATPTPTPPGTPTPTPAPVTTRLFVSVPPLAFPGSPFSIMVSARDQFDNTAVGYTGTVHLTSTAASANLPADSTLTNGSAIFRPSIGLPGTYTITATDTGDASIAGTSNTFTIGPGGPSPTPTATATAAASPTSTPVPTPPETTSPTPTATATATPAPSPTATPTSSPTPPTQALNLSTRLRVQTGDNAGIGGFIITGTAPKYLLFRGIGPSLTALGITGALANPTLDLRRPDGTRILANDNWRDTQETEIQATGIPPTDNLEAAIVQTLDPGSYTIILRGMGMTSGIGLLEIYDLDPAPVSKLANISTRALVETGANVVIAGFIVGGTSGSDKIAVRGLGPSLSGLGISNALANPKLELRDGNGTLLIANNDWQDDPTGQIAAQLHAAGLALTSNLESGVIATLPPGLYTTLLSGVNNGTGVGLVEVYDLGAP